ncbi:amidase [Cyanobacteria bacterium FACHB-471]|nr:amidase [Cyanobacteria bacterium FACHB-471]
MNPVDLAFAPALEQARLIRKKEVSPLELVQLYLERIERLDSRIGSYFTVIADLALEDAKAKTESLTEADPEEKFPPFFGVPTAIKDLNALAGVPCSYGNPMLKDQIATHDAAVVSRMKQAGFIILGKTATSEVGSLPYTEPEGFPPTRNPWNLDYTPGGSSGGAAAAIASGFCSIAQGSDGGGSIRGPASCCNLVGIKPSRGRVSYAPVGDCQSGIATNGPLARTVTDAAALLDVMAGYETGDPYWLPTPSSLFIETSQQGLAQPLKVAFSTGIHPIGEADPVGQQAVLETATLIQELGHTVEQACPDCSDLIEPFSVVWRAGVAASGIPAEALGSFNRWLLSHNDSSGDYLRAVWAMQTIARRIVAFFENYDVLVLPVYLHPPIRVGEFASLTPEETLQRIIYWIAPCPPFNATGQPAIAIPATFTPEGLPVGVQIVGRPAAEATIIALAAQIESVNRWSEKRPVLED